VKEQILALIKAERDTWVKPVGFNYRKALTELIRRIEEMK